MNTSESTVTEHNVSLMHTMTMPGQSAREKQYNELKHSLLQKDKTGSKLWVKISSIHIHKI